MAPQLSLIKTDFKAVERRIFPRFPFTYMVFKSAVEQGGQAFEVCDISFTGMQLCLKNGGHQYTPDMALSGELHWGAQRLSVQALVRWVRGNRVGISFQTDKSLLDKVRRFLSPERVVEEMRPLHQSELDLEFPSDLKYWLRADGPSEVFVWQHKDGELARFQVIYLDVFVEWEDGKGLRSGKVVTKRDLDTPLVAEDEFVFSMDENVDAQKVQHACQLVDILPEGLIPVQAAEFLRVKLGHHLSN